MKSFVTVTIPLLSFGMVQGWLSPMISVLQSPEGPSPEPYTSADISWMASVTYITAIIFGAPMGFLTDRYGRKMMTLVTTLSLVVSYFNIDFVCLLRKQGSAFLLFFVPFASSSSLVRPLVRMTSFETLNQHFWALRFHLRS